MGMRDFCCVRGCDSRRYQPSGDSVSYYKIPKSPPGRREAWIRFTRNKRDVKNCWKICSKHFVLGRPSRTISETDYLPTLKRPKKRRPKSEEKPDDGCLESSMTADTTHEELDSSGPVLGVMSIKQERFRNNEDHPVEMDTEMKGESDDGSDSEDYEQEVVSKVIVKIESYTSAYATEDYLDGDDGVGADDKGAGEDYLDGDDDVGSDDKSAGEDYLDADDGGGADDKGAGEDYLGADDGVGADDKSDCAHDDVDDGNTNNMVAEDNSGEKKPNIKPFIIDNDLILPPEYSSSYDSSGEDTEEEKKKIKKAPVAICYICGENYRYPSNLDRHIKRCERGAKPRPPYKKNPIPRSERPQSYACKLCYKKYNRESTLVHHVAKIHEKKLDFGYTCTVCGKQLTTKCGFDRHMIGMHSENKEHFCSTCGKGFALEMVLKKHMLSHSDERPHVCSYCGMGFKISKSRTQHEIIVHNMPSELPMFQCDVCHAQFVTKSRLKIHMPMHDGPSLECKYCHRRFTHKGNLKNHIKGVHEGDTRYECNHCGRRFGNQYNLKVHIRIHTGEKPHVCPQCGKGFADICNYRRHEMKCPTVKDGPDIKLLTSFGL